MLKKTIRYLSFVLYLMNIQIFTQVESDKTLVYHTVKTRAALESVKKRGLYSFKGTIYHPFAMLGYIKEELGHNFRYRSFFKEYLFFLYYFLIKKEDKKSLGFTDQSDVIYFKPEEPDIRQIANFAIEVDPNKTYVYNLHHRGITSDETCKEADRLYQQSRVLLKDYLRYLDEAKQMVLARPDLEVQLDPETAEPFYLTSNDLRKNQIKVDGKWVERKSVSLGCSVYSGEVIISRTHIPPQELKFIQDKIGRWQDSNPVKNNEIFK